MPDWMEKRMDKIQFVLFVILLSAIVIGCERKTNSLADTVYHVTYRIQAVPENSRNNSGFIFKVDDTTPPLYLTAHHAISGYGMRKYYDWDRLQDYVRDASIWSIQDDHVHFQLGRNLPIPNAKTIKLDLAAFYLARGGPANYLKAAASPAKVGDTVRLFAKLHQTGVVLNSAVVIYTTDSLLVYQLVNPALNELSGSSGSPVLNNRNEVVSNSFGGLPVSSIEQREEMAREYPFIRQFLERTEMGKTYGIGVPIDLIRISLIQAIELNQRRPVSLTP